VSSRHKQGQSIHMKARSKSTVCRKTCTTTIQHDDIFGRQGGGDLLDTRIMSFLEWGYPCVGFCPIRLSRMYINITRNHLTKRDGHVHRTLPGRNTSASEFPREGDRITPNQLTSYGYSVQPWIGLRLSDGRQDSILRVICRRCNGQVGIILLDGGHCLPGNFDR
jgi:hypothetical protein